MRKESQLTDKSRSGLEMPDSVILLNSKSHYQKDEHLREQIFHQVIKGIEASFSPSVFVGTVGSLDERYGGYRLCLDFCEVRDVIYKYDSVYEDIIIRQEGTRLHFTLIHYDGRHEMELRRFTKYGYEHLGDAIFTVCVEKTLLFIDRHTSDFGKIDCGLESEAASCDSNQICCIIR